MKGEEHNDGSYLQCQYCGHIYYTKKEISMEKLIVRFTCPKCGESKGLNCGNNKEDIYIYANPNVDERFYTY